MPGSTRKGSLVAVSVREKVLAFSLKLVKKVQKFIFAKKKMKAIEKFTCPSTNCPMNLSPALSPGP